MIVEVHVYAAGLRVATRQVVVEDPRTLVQVLENVQEGAIAAATSVPVDTPELERVLAKVDLDIVRERARVHAARKPVVDPNEGYGEPADAGDRGASHECG